MKKLILNTNNQKDMDIYKEILFWVTIFFEAVEDDDTIILLVDLEEYLEWEADSFWSDVEEDW